jgi:hypothetical protein
MGVGQQCSSLPRESQPKLVCVEYSCRSDSPTAFGRPSQAFRHSFDVARSSQKALKLEVENPVVGIFLSGDAASCQTNLGPIGSSLHSYPIAKTCLAISFLLGTSCCFCSSCLLLLILILDSVRRGPESTQRGWVVDKAASSESAFDQRSNCRLAPPAQPARPPPICRCQSFIPFPLIAESAQAQASSSLLSLLHCLPGISSTIHFKS